MKHLKFFKSVEIQSTYGFNAKPLLEITKLYQINHLSNGHKITDWEKFGKFVEVNGDKTQVEMAKLWSVEIREISDRTISRALRKIGFTRKKKLMVIKNEMKLNDKHSEKR